MFVAAVRDMSVKLVSGRTAISRDLNGDGKYEDVKGNGRKDFTDIVWLFKNL
jgi:hypothetical protein